MLPTSRYPTPADNDAFYRGVLDEVRVLPGVDSAGYTNFAPLVFKSGRSVVLVDGQPPPERSEILRHLAHQRDIGV